MISRTAMGCTAVVLLVSIGCEPSAPMCVEDGFGSTCTTDESVVLLDRNHLQDLPRVRLAVEDHRWSLSSNGLTGDPLYSVAAATGIACASTDGAFAVLEERPPGVLLLASRDGTARAWHGGRGDGPGEFSRVHSVWPAGPCQAGVYDQRHHRVSWVTVGQGVDSTAVLAFPQGFNLWHEIVGVLSDGTLTGFGLVSPPPVPEPATKGLHTAAYRVGRYDGSSDVEVMRDLPGIVQFLVQPFNLGQAPYRPDTQMWTDGEDLWVANGHWPLLRRIGPDGQPRESLWIDLERTAVSAADRERFLEDHVRRGGDDPEIIARRRTIASNFEFPGMKPYYYEAHPMGDEVWLRVSDEPRGRGGTWLIVEPSAARGHMFIALPEGTRPLARSGDIVLLHHIDSMGVTQLQAFHVNSQLATSGRTALRAQDTPSTRPRYIR